MKRTGSDEGEKDDNQSHISYLPVVSPYPLFQFTNPQIPPWIVAPPTPRNHGLSVDLPTTHSIISNPPSISSYPITNSPFHDAAELPFLDTQIELPSDNEGDPVVIPDFQPLFQNPPKSPPAAEHLVVKTTLYRVGKRDWQDLETLSAYLNNLKSQIAVFNLINFWKEKKILTHLQELIC